MSKPKNENSKHPEVEEITVSNFSLDVPGVTQLLNRSAPDANAGKNLNSFDNSIEIQVENQGSPGDATRIFESHPEPTRAELHSGGLAGFGIDFQLIFVEENGVLRYQGVKELKKSSFPAWRHSFFKRMKIDLRTLSISVSFQEFSSDRFPFQKEAFGLAHNEFVQCVRDPRDRKKMHVFLSKHSLLGKKNQIESLLGGNPDSGDSGSDDLKIELAS